MAPLVSLSLRFARCNDGRQYVTEMLVTTVARREERRNSHIMKEWHDFFVQVVISLSSLKVGFVHIAHTYFRIGYQQPTLT